MKACIPLKSCKPLYTCPSTPFYRETKELLHSNITLRSKEYSKWEHVHKCLVHPVIYGAWLQIFTSFPSFHTSNPDFWCHAFDLAHPWCIFHSRDSPKAWTLASEAWTHLWSLVSRTTILFRSFTFPWNVIKTSKADHPSEHFTSEGN
jgi:hypothetical protein